MEIGDGDSISAGTLRRWVWHTWEDILEEVDKERRGEMWSVFNGDTVEADYKQRSAQLISRDVNKIAIMAHDVFAPVMQMSAGGFFIRGTEAHVGPNATVEESFAGLFDNTQKNPETNKYTWWHLPLVLDGVRFDIMHHPQGGSGGRPQNSQTVVDRLASDTLFRAANEGTEIPDVVIRSHLHGYKDSGGAFRIRGIVTPALCLLSAYGYRIGLSHDGELGCVLIYCDAGRFYVKPILRKPRIQQWQVIK